MKQPINSMKKDNLILKFIEQKAYTFMFNLTFIIDIY